jgi:hypothetical protein
MPTERRAISRRDLAREFVGGANSCADNKQLFISLARLQPSACALYPATTGGGSDRKQIHLNSTIHQ